MFKRLLAILLIVLTLVPVAGAADNRDELKETLRTLLRDNPDLVLEVLREHSETVLEIAQQGANQRRRKALVAQWKTDLEDPKKVNLADRPVRGEANAPVTVVAYSDFTCPYCQQAAGTVEMLLANYKGKVRYVFKQMPLETHENARTASNYYVAASLQDPAKAWKLYEAVFADRDRLVTEGEPFLKKVAQEAGLDMQRLATDIKGRKVKALIEEDMAEARKLGVQGTPYFLVNDLVVRGALPLDLFSDAVDMALEKAGAKK